MPTSYSHWNGFPGAEKRIDQVLFWMTKVGAFNGQRAGKDLDWVEEKKVDPREIIRQA